MREFLEHEVQVVHLQNAHNQIREAIGNIERELNSKDLPCDRVRTCDLFRRLRDALIEHFEEEGGCLERAVNGDPRLATEVAEIEKEHGRIVKLLDRLIKRSHERVTDDFRESFRQFAKILRAHETAENRVLHTAFGTNEFDTATSNSAYGESR